MRQRRSSTRVRRRRSRTKGNTKIVPWVLIVAMIMLSVVALFGVQLLKPPTLDETTFCPEETGAVAGLVMLFDLTDAINRTQRARLQQVLNKTIIETPVNTLVAVGAVRADSTRRGARFKRCKPDDGMQANELIENPRLIAERYNEEFKQPLDNVLEKILNIESASQSPIMESLQAVLAETPGFLDGKYPRRVIIISDLIQHSPVFSFYQRDNWQTFTRSPDHTRLALNLADVGVEIWRLPRTEANVDMTEVDDFWVNYFKKSGVFSISTRPLGDL